MRSPRFAVQHESAVPRDDAWLTAGEREVAAGLRSAARRRDWRLGRWTAKRLVLRELGLCTAPAALCALAIAADCDGGPVPWLEGARLPFALSLSHRAGSAFACIAPDGVALGCDLERDEPRSDAFLRHFLAGAEQRELATHPAAGRAATLLWSGKESALKALGTGLRCDARDVVVQVASLDLDARGWQPVQVQRPDRAPLTGWWCRRGAWFLTVVADAPLGAPVALA